MQLISTKRIKLNHCMELVHIWYPTNFLVIKLKKQHVIEITTEITNQKLAHVASNFDIELISHEEI